MLKMRKVSLRGESRVLLKALRGATEPVLEFRSSDAYPRTSYFTFKQVTQRIYNWRHRGQMALPTGCSNEKKVKLGMFLAELLLSPL